MESKAIASTLVQEVVGGERELDRAEAEVVGESSLERKGVGWTDPEQQEETHSKAKAKGVCFHKQRPIM